MKQNQKGFTVVEILISLVVITGIVFGGYYVYQHNHKTTKLSAATEAQINPESLPALLPKDILSVDKIKELATAQKPTLTVSNIELEKDDGKLIYKVELSDGSELSFNALTGDRATSDTHDADDSDDEDLPKGVKVSVSFEQALAAALARKPGGTINKIKLDGEDGKPVYKVTFTDGTKIFINAVDSSVVKVRVEGKNKSNTSGSDRGSGSSSSSHKSDSKDSSSDSQDDEDSGDDQDEDSGDDQDEDSGDDQDEDSGDDGDSGDNGN